MIKTSQQTTTTTKNKQKLKTKAKTTKVKNKKPGFQKGHTPWNKGGVKGKKVSKAKYSTKNKK